MSAFAATGFSTSAFSSSAFDFGEVVAVVTTKSQEIEIRRKWYVRRGKKLHIFNTAQEADTFIEAEQEAETLAAQKTSRRARKRLREKLYTAPAQTIDIGGLSTLFDRYKLEDPQALIAKQDFDALMRIYAQALELQDEEDLEMLLLAL